MRRWERRRVLSAEETAANAARKAAREAAAMTCQCCGRKHLANNGVIAHHGYERPDYGWQTASCMGARYLPFEVDRERLGDMIKLLAERHARMVEWRNEIATEQTPIRHNYTVYVRDNAAMKTNKEFKSVEVTRANFDEIRKVREHLIYEYNYDDYLANEIANQDRAISSIKEHIDQSQVRFDGWKKTHGWSTNKEWIKL